jgi:hypothetical protein
MKFRQDNIFAIILACVVALLLFKAFEYGPQTRLALVGTGIPLLILLLIYVIQGFFPSFSIQFNKMFRAVTHSQPKDGKEFSQLPDMNLSFQKIEYTVILWLLALVGMIIIFGLLVSLPIFTLLFMKFYGSETWRFSFVVAIVSLLFIYLIFFLLLNLTSYEGIFSNLIL